MKSSVFPPKNQLNPSVAVNSMSTSDNEQAQLLDHKVSVQVQLPADSKGRNRASAVVLGLALSMGTSSLLLPTQTKKVLALDSLPFTSQSLSVQDSLATPSPIASPVPSSLELALTQATDVNPTVMPTTGYNPVIKAGDELLNLSKQSLSAAKPLDETPTPAVTSTPTVTMAATLSPQAAEPVPVATTLPGFILPLSDAAHATPAAETTVSLATPTYSSPASSAAPIVAPTPTATPTVVATPQPEAIAASSEAAAVTAASTPPAVTSPAFATPTEEPIQTPKLIEFTADSLPVTNGLEVSVLPQIKQLALDNSTVKLASISTPTSNSTLPSSPAKGMETVASVQTLEPTLISQDPSFKLAQTLPTSASEAQGLTAYLSPDSQRQVPSQPTITHVVGTPATPNALSYRVGRGDTLNIIARQYGISVSELIAANNLTNPNQILVDQELTIPQTNNLRLNASIDRETTPVIAASIQTPDAAWTSNVSAAPVPEVTEPGVSNSYVQGLKSDIEALQRKYQQQSNQIAVVAPNDLVSNQPLPAAPQIPATLTALVKPAAVPPSVSEPVNSEFIASATAPALPRPSTTKAWQAQPTEISSTIQRQQVAVAPLSAAAYAPTIDPPAGQAVSPELPPLSAANTYLPSGLPQSKGYIWPAKGLMSSGYGWRWGRMHRGVDIAAPTGTPIVASATGVVEYAQWNSGGYGYLIDIRHPDGSLTRYGHNNRLLVREGQQVQQGQLIAEMGSTGFSTGPHCHFEIHAAGQGPVNPMAFLPKQNQG